MSATSSARSTPTAASVLAELRARGIEFLTPPKSPPWGGWRCFARDPDGFVVEVEDHPGA